MAIHFVDSACNEMRFEMVGYSDEHECSVGIATMLDDPGKGYVAECGTELCLGTEERPGAYDMAIMTWFGPGERFPSAASALSSLYPKRLD